jgi:uncharacterized protein YbjT (DUF2867 family)
MKIVVIGGSGLIGSRLVAHLQSLGHHVVPAALDTGVNTITGEGLADAVEGASVVVDVSNSPSYEDDAVRSFFETSTRNLLRTERDAEVGHHVLLSIVGTERLTDSAYYSAKLAQEQLVATSPIPYSIVHSTQFFEFIHPIAKASFDGEVVRVAPVVVQPIAADDVVRALAMVSVGAPLNRILEIAGPERFRLDGVVRHVLDTRGEAIRVVSDVDALYFGGHLETHTLLPADDAEYSPTRLDEWLVRPTMGARS